MFLFTTSYGNVLCCACGRLTFLLSWTLLALLETVLEVPVPSDAALPFCVPSEAMLLLILLLWADSDFRGWRGDVDLE